MSDAQHWEELNPTDLWDAGEIRDLERFIDQVNTTLVRPAHRRLTKEDCPFEACDSLELVFLGVHLAGLGAELPPGIEKSLTSFAEVHDHLIRRLEAEGHV